MAWRIVVFLALLAVFGAAGALVQSHWGAVAGVALAGVAWFVFDLARGLRVLRWVRRGEATEAPVMEGVWGEVVDRVRRALRRRDRDVALAQQRLQEFLAAIQASPNGVVILDDSGHIEWCNQIAAQHLGIDAARDLQQLVANLVRDPAFTAYLARGDYAQDVVIPGRGATPTRPVRISVQLHPYGDGRKLLLSRDVTALEQAETMRRDFVANVSHEIRTPLTVLAGFVETLQTVPLDDEERTRYLALMSQQAQRMQSLVSDLLTLSRLEGSPPPRTGEWMAVQPLMAQCEAEARALVRVLGKDLAMSFSAPAGLEISGASAEILSAMSNLVSNAVRYTPAGRVDVAWKVGEDGGAEFAVTDTGPGIAPEHLPRLTERFYRIDRSRSRETGGTGLGLAIVKHAVQRHGGQLRIGSMPGRGSTFTLVLPAARVRGVTAQTEAARAPA